jgi:hypothetical protein
VKTEKTSSGILKEYPEHSLSVSEDQKSVSAEPQRVSGEPRSIADYLQGVSDPLWEYQASLGASRADSAPGVSDYALRAI